MHNEEREAAPGEHLPVQEGPRNDPRKDPSRSLEPTVRNGISEAKEIKGSKEISENKEIGVAKSINGISSVAMVFANGHSSPTVCP